MQLWASFVLAVLLNVSCDTGTQREPWFLLYPLADVPSRSLTGYQLSGLHMPHHTHTGPAVCS